MNLDKDTCYKITKAKDARFDGVFYLGVKSTGIYCRPICKVPAPKEENCTYYESAAQAETAGFRPCLRCRPEMAPKYSEFEQQDELMSQVLEYLESHDYHAGIVGKASEYFGISSRHMNRLFHEVFGVAPKDYIMTKRLLRGKALLTDTNLTITKVSELSGFGSPSRFSAALKKHYKLTPTAIRKEKKKINNYITMNLFYRPPYSWDLMMGFLKMRAIPHVEQVSDHGIYQRTIRYMDKEIEYLGWIEVKPVEKDCKVIVKISNSLEKVVIPVTNIIRKAFDLDVDPSAFPEVLSKEVRLPGCFNGFEVACRAIIGQQVSVKAATTLSGRIADAIGIEAHTPWKEVDRYFPSPIDVDFYEDLEDILGRIGIIRARSNTIKGLAKGLINKEISFEKGQKVDELSNNLQKIKGIGPWSAEYILMRALSWPDAFPVSDLVIKNKLLNHLSDEEGNQLSDLKDNTSKYILNKKYELAAKQWIEQHRPWSSYISIGIWNDLVRWK